MSFISRNFFNPHYNSIENREKKLYENYLNLSSNELHHSTLKDLNNFFRNNNLNEIIRCYPYHQTTKRSMARHFGLGQNQILLTAGSDYTINFLLNALGHQKSIILSKAEYYSYKNYAAINGIKGLTFDFKIETLVETLFEFKKILKQSVPSLVVLTNPNGITGHKLETKDMLKIAKCCYENNHIFLIDEAYSAFCNLDHSFLLKDYENIIILKTFSKSHGLAGLRFSTVFASEEIINYLRKTGIENTVSGLSMAYFVYLLENHSVIEKIIRDVNLTKNKLAEAITEKFPNWVVAKTATNFVMIDTFNEKLAKKITNYFEKNGIVIKDLGTISDFKTCIRVTIPAAELLDHIMFLFQQFKEEYMNV